MVVVKNGEGKTVCHADAEDKRIVITRKGQQTAIRFLEDGTMKTENTQIQ